MKARLDLSVVVPLKNEQDVVPELARRLQNVLDALALESEVILVDDGSSDGTHDLLCGLAERDPRFHVLSFSRNFGHQAAITAGLDYTLGRAVVVIDGDLQDPPELIPELIAAWRDGFDVVHAVRRSRREGLMLRLCYGLFYRVFRLISDLDLQVDSGDFCLMDRRVVRAMRAQPERVRFVRGLRRHVGFRQTCVAYDRDARAAGRSKYSFGGLCRLAIDGIVSFSSKPLRLATYLGLTTALAAVLLTVWVLADALAARTAPAGWASTLIVMLFLGAVQLVCLGILGEYMRVLFQEAKQRPPYLIMSKTGRRFARRPRTRRDERQAKPTVPAALRDQPSHA